MNSLHIAYFRLVEIKDLKIGIIALGWLGEKLAEHLSTIGANVWGTTRNPDKKKLIEQNSEIDVLIWQNIEGISIAMQKRLSKTEILILNLPPSVFDQSYADGLAQFLVYLNPSAKVIFTSSTSVYPSKLTDTTEDYEFHPNEINAIREAEMKLESHLGNNLTILRLAGLIGEDRHPVYYLAKKDVNDKPNQRINLIHRKDIIQIIEKVIATNYFGEILNVCHPEHPSRKEYYTKKAIHLNLPSLYFTQSVLNEGDKVVNCSKLMKKLQYKTFIPL